jgi:hypothetical protein
MRSIHRLVACVLGAGLLLGVTASTAAASADSHGKDKDSKVTVYGLTTRNKLVTFSLDRPDKVRRSVRVKGLANDERLIGIDRRPKDNLLYGVTKTRSGSDLITVDPTTGRTTFVATLVSAPTATTPRGAGVDLLGREFGFDFNPAADALRIVSDRGQNLRVIPSARTAADGTQLQPGDTFTDKPLNRAPGVVATGVSGAAYSNNDNDPATATTLYDIDYRKDQLLTQNPPNDGTLTNPLPLGQTTGRRVGFDIRTTPQGDLAVASLSKTGYRTTRIVTVDVTTGKVRTVGKFRYAALRDIALAA